MKIKNHGFTLLEMLITIAVLAVVTALAAPGFRSIIQNNRATTITNDIVTAVQLARSESIRRRINITVCRSNSTQTACDNGTNWSAGWLVLAGSTVLQAWAPPPGNATITAPAAALTFLPTGRINASAIYEVSITLPGAVASSARKVCVKPTGRVISTSGNCVN